MIEYDFNNKIINVITPYKRSELYLKIKNDWESNKEYQAYEFPIINMMPNMFQFRAGWTLSKESIKNLSFMAIDIAKGDEGDKVIQRYISIQTIGDIADVPKNYKIWRGELLELFNKDLDYTDFILSTNADAFSILNIDIKSLAGFYMLTKPFLSQEYIYEQYNKETHPEWFL